MLDFNFDSFPTITTDRLVLREVTIADKHAIFFLKSNEGVLKYLDKYPFTSIDESVDYIERMGNLFKNKEALLWGIALKDDPKNIIGTICYWRMLKEHYRAEIGYVLHPSFQNKGIMNEAITAVIDFGFNKMKLHSIEAKVNPANAGSINLLEKNGFIREGYFKEDYYFDGKFLDTGVYSLLTPHR